MTSSGISGRIFSNGLLIIFIYLEFTYGKIVKDVKLPTSITPNHYRIKLIPILEAEDFRLFGNVRMDFTVNTATDVIVMHASKLNLMNNTVRINALKGRSNDPPSEEEKATDRRSRSEGIKIHGVTYDVDREFVKISLSSKLKSNRSYQLNFNYRGTLAQDLLGFYRGYYLDKHSQTKKWYATTQMEPTYARRAFPCLDEPAMKATFQIILGRQSNMSSLSNMPLIKTEPMRHKEGWFWDHYEKSVPMPTYLVAFLVSDFAWRQGSSLIRHHANASNSSSTEIRIWARSEVINQSSLAANVTIKMLEFLEHYFQVPYPLPKLDLVAVPDFSAGAMENWGLILFRETALLHDPKSPVAKGHFYVLEVIAHELAHQWFGNLVTMKWWNDLWLNEGFASYAELKVLQQISPEYEVESQKIHDTQAALRIDCLDSSHPISVEIQHPDQIDEISDAITYSKGSAIIRMMNHFLGESSFRRGLTHYLNQYKYGNALQDDLWSTLTRQWHLDSTDSRNMDVKSIMDTWTLQMGYPLVTISRNYSHQSAVMEQKRFLRSSTVLASDNEVKGGKESPTPSGWNYRWWIPISLTDSENMQFGENNTQPHLWLPPENQTVQHKLTVNASSWILANVQVTGYYRVNYDHRNWQLLRQQLFNHHQVIHVMNRAQLIDDIFALASTKILSYPMAFDFIQYLPKEEHYVPWATAVRSLSYVNRMLTYAPELGRYKSFLLSLVKPALLRVGEDFHSEDGPLKKLVRILLTEQACELGYRPCIRRAQQQFENWMNQSDPIHYTGINPDLRPSVYCTAIRHGSQLEWDFAWQMALNATSALHQETILKALGCSREPWILIRYLSLILDPESGIRKQDSPRVIDAIANNPVGRALAFQFVQDHWDELMNYFGGPFKTLETLRSTTGDFNSQADLNKITSFLGKKSSDLETTRATYKKLLATVSANIEWMEENYQPLVHWLKNRGF